MSAGPRVVLATRNAHKVGELRAVLAPLLPGVEVLGVDAFDDVPEVAETGVDFISVGALTHSVRVFDLGLDLHED